VQNNWSNTMKAAMKARLEAIQNKGRHLYLAGGTAVALAATGPANAAIDVSGVTTAISDQTTNVELIAVAVLSVLAILAGVTYLRRVVR
jgi:membrane protein implicated in regulation of membrane protease activity